MESLLQLGLANSITAALLAILVAVAVRTWRNPHFAHALWLIVLFRLVMPPVVPLSAPIPAWFTRLPSFGAPVPESDSMTTMAADDRALNGRRGVLALPDPAGRPVRSVRTATTKSPIASMTRGARIGRDPKHATLPPMRIVANLLGSVWIAGSVVYLFVVAIRAWRFWRGVQRTSNEVPIALRQELCDVARSLSLKRTPRSKVIDGTLPPMIWSGWHATVLLPRALVASIDAPKRRLLLLHELTHLRRGDHGIRWFAIAVLALYWWNPLAWWAVRRLGDAQEECCDAEIVLRNPQESECYGEALLIVSEFVSHGWLPAPAVSIGVERTTHLKRRMIMILNTTPRPTLSKLQRSAVGGCAIAILSVSWKIAAAQVAPASPTTISAREQKPKDDVRHVIANAKSASPSGKKEGPAAGSVVKESAAKGDERPISRKVPLIDDPSLQPAPTDDRLQRLLKERYNAALDWLRESYRQWQVGDVLAPTEALDAARRFADAKLTLSANSATQIGLRREYLDFTLTIEKRTQALVTTHQIRRQFLDAAREARLDAEIKLLQAQTKWRDQEARLSKGDHGTQSQGEFNPIEGRIAFLKSSVRIAQAELDTAKATVQERQADLSRALAKHRFRKTQFVRVRDLAEHRVVDDRLVEEKRNELEMAEADVKGAQAATKGAESQIAAKQARLDQARLELESMNSL
jgi:beta-lactamase regulating signal transducer with metallopeptidase domain